MKARSVDLEWPVPSASVSLLVYSIFVWCSKLRTNTTHIFSATLESVSFMSETEHESCDMHAAQLFLQCINCDL